MALSKLLVANRGEIALRVLRAAVDPRDRHGHGLLRGRCDRAAHPRRRRGARARGTGRSRLPRHRPDHRGGCRLGCDSLHPGYGFLAESAEFARRCAQAGLTFVGPSVEVLESFGDKVRARAIAAEHDVPVIAGTSSATSLEQARAFLEGLPAG